MAYDANEFKGPGGVNVAECLRLANIVERYQRFDMTREFHTCGTPACIAGIYYGPCEPGRYAVSAAHHKTRVGLGLGYKKAAELFATAVHGFIPTQASVAFDATPAHAAACLRKLAETGEVDWLGTKPA